MQIERRCRRLQHFRTTGMQHPTSNVAAPVPVIGEKRVDVVTEVFANQHGNLR